MAIFQQFQKMTFKTDKLPAVGWKIDQFVLLKFLYGKFLEKDFFSFPDFAFLRMLSPLAAQQSYFLNFSRSRNLEASLRLKLVLRYLEIELQKNSENPI